MNGQPPHLSSVPTSGEIPLTPAEVRALLKPRRDWLSIAVALVGLLAAAGAVGKFIYTAPTEASFKDHETRLKTVEIDGAVFKQNVEGLRKDVSDGKQSQENFQRDVKVDIRTLLERRR